MATNIFLGNSAKMKSDNVSTADKNGKLNHAPPLLEKCSFVCHLFLFPIGLMYLLWLLVSIELLVTPEVATYYPNKEYALNVPVTALFLFLAAPFLYAAFNSLTVPEINSLDTVEDVYTRSSLKKMMLLSKELPLTDSTLPEICDLDPSTLIWCARNDNSTLLPAPSK